MLTADKVDAEMAYLQIAIDKTAGTEEREAWSWLQRGGGGAPRRADRLVSAMRCSSACAASRRRWPSRPATPT